MSCLLIHAPRLPPHACWIKGAVVFNPCWQDSQRLRCLRTARVRLTHCCFAILIARYRVIESANDTRIFEHEQGPAAGGEGQGAVGYESDACPRPVVDVLFTDSFRGGNGTQVRLWCLLFKVPVGVRTIADQPERRVRAMSRLSRRCVGDGDV